MELHPIYFELKNLKVRQEFVFDNLSSVMYFYLNTNAGVTS